MVDIVIPPLVEDEAQSLFNEERVGQTTEAISNALTLDANGALSVGNFILFYANQYLFVKYADDANGGGFSDLPTNKAYYGLRNDTGPLESENPADYVYYQTIGFGTTRFLWYATTGGRQISFVVSETAPNQNYLQVPTGAINLDIVTSIAVATDSGSGLFTSDGAVNISYPKPNTAVEVASTENLIGTIVTITPERVFGQTTTWTTPPGSSLFHLFVTGGGGGGGGVGSAPTAGNPGGNSFIATPSQVYVLGAGGAGGTVGSTQTTGTASGGTPAIPDIYGLGGGGATSTVGTGGGVGGEGATLTFDTTIPEGTQLLINVGTGGEGGQGSAAVLGGQGGAYGRSGLSGTSTGSDGSGAGGSSGICIVRYDGSLPGVLQAVTRGVLIIDGYQVKGGDTILLKDQTDPTQNGVWDVLDPGAPQYPWQLARNANFATFAQMAQQNVIVLRGLVNEGKIFRFSVSPTGVINVNAVIISSNEGFSDFRTRDGNSFGNRFINYSLTPPANTLGTDGDFYINLEPVPVATRTTVGGVIVGNGLFIDSTGTIRLANPPTTPGTYSLRCTVSGTPPNVSYVFSWS